MKTILVVTDESSVVHSVSRWLEEAGYAVVCARLGQDALEQCGDRRPDLVLLDVAAPGAATSRGLWTDGVELCRHLREGSDLPILALTADLDEAERVVEQLSCADDFVQKPCSSVKLVTRVRALLRWAARRNPVGVDVIEAGDVVLNPAHHQAFVAGKPVDLTRTEFALLAALASEPGRPLSRAQLARALNTHRGICERTIDSHIKNLRTKIEHDPRHPCYVCTVRGAGYRLRV